jgi:MFS family permease
MSTVSDRSSATVSYRSLLATPGASIFFLATFLGRIPLAMRALGCVLLVEQLTGSYGLAGVVGAMQTLVAAFASPQLGRFADRYGERMVLIVSMVAHTIGMIALILAAYAGAHAAILLLAAALVGGSSMPFGSLSRARWVATLGKGRALERAYALESMADEAGFIVGPMLVVPLSVSVNAAAGLICSLLLTIGATLMLTRREAPAIADGPAVRTTPRPEASEAGKSVIGIPGIQVLVGSLLFLGIIFGSVEIVLVAFAEDLGSPSAASVLAALFALGSFVGAVGYGAIRWHSPVDRRLKIAIWWLALGTIPILLANSIPTMGIAVFVTGLAISPGMIAANTVVEHLAPPKMLTEAFSWIGSALSTGAAVGSVVAGVVLDEISVRGGQAIGIFGGGLAALVVIVWAKYLRADPEGHRMEPSTTWCVLVMRRKLHTLCDNSALGSWRSVHFLADDTPAISQPDDFNTTTREQPRWCSIQRLITPSSKETSFHFLRQRSALGHTPCSTAPARSRAYVATRRQTAAPSTSSACATMPPGSCAPPACCGWSYPTMWTRSVS